MTKLQQFFIIPLPRNIDYAACINENDLKVLFVPASKMPTKEEDCAQLFSTWNDMIEERQEHVKPQNKRKLVIYLVLSEKCNLKCIYCDIVGKTDLQQKHSHMGWDIVKAAMDILHSRLAGDPELSAQIVFFGGEPILNWSILVETCE